MSDALDRLLLRLDPIFDRVDRLLRQWVGSAPDAETFEAAHAFRWRTGRGVGRLEPIEAVAEFDLDDLIGVDRSIEALDRNTRQLLAGLPFNDVLLHGERGTGKSSAVRGLLSRYADRGLRVVEVDRNDLAELPQLLGSLREGTSRVPDRYSFLVFCDDLSFGSTELGFRELKAALEGGIEARPPRVCVVATSNRRHLLPETMEENRQARVDEEGQLHLGEVLEEKLALSDRFGLVLGFYACSQPVYLEIVSHWLGEAGLDELDELAREAALRFALERGGRSGRIARQFANEWIGRTRLGAAGPDRGSKRIR
ncbi:MAG TPA: ATP-binding protein [Deltaproteobacteria bacterium]|nr:ATP-binding protein [Deltaproteobacteria bacterium]